MEFALVASEFALTKAELKEPELGTPPTTDVDGVDIDSVDGPPTRTRRSGSGSKRERMRIVRFDAGAVSIERRHCG